MILQATIFAGTVPLLMSCHLVLNLRNEYYVPRSAAYSINATQLYSMHSRERGIHQLDSMGFPRISSWYSQQPREDVRSPQGLYSG